MKLKNIKSYGLVADKSMKVWIQLLRTFKKIRVQESEFIQSFDLTMNQFQVLEVLYHRGDLSVGTITELTSSTPGNITVVVRNLKRDGFILSLPSPVDKRASILSITEKGREKIQALFPTHAKNFEKYFSVLSEEEMDTLFNLLRKLQKA